MQDGHPVAYYSKKLTKTQQNYSTMEKELLSIVLTLSEFRTMLLGAKLAVFTDHKNLTFRTLNSSRILRWRIFLEEYGASFQHIEGKCNVLADAFSRLPCMDAPSILEGKTPGKSTVVDEESLFNSLLDDVEMLECMVNFPVDGAERNPLDLPWIQRTQFEDH